MKKFIWMLAAALPMMFTSCGDDNDEVLTLDQASMSVNYKGEAVKLKASEKNCTWTSENEFIATVDGDGKVTPVHAGTTTVTAMKDGEKATCTVTVLPTNNNYVLPVLTFGTGMDALKDAVKKQDLGLNLVDEDDYTEEGIKYNELYYAKDMNFGYPWYAYIFADSKLVVSTLTVSNENADGLYKWLEQWYAEYGETADGYVFRNAASEAAATEWAELEIDDDDTTVYFTNVKSSTKGGDAFSSAAMRVAKRAVASKRAK